MDYRRGLVAILGLAAVALVFLVGYMAQTRTDRPKEIVQQIHDRVSCAHPRPDSEEC